MYAIGWGPMLAIGLVFGAVDGIRLSGSRAVVPAMVDERRRAGARRARDRARHRADAGRPAARARARGAGRARRRLHDQAVRTRDDRDRTRRGRAPPERTALPRAGAARVRHHHGDRRRRGHPLREPGVRGDPRLLDAPKRSACRASSSRTPTTSTRSVRRSSAESRHHRSTDRSGRSRGSCQRDGTLALVRRDRHRPDRTTRASAGWVANLRDITERKAQEAALNEAQEVFRHAFDDAPIGIGLVDLDGRIQRANRSMGVLLGRTQEELVGISDQRSDASRRPRHERRLPGAAEPQRDRLLPAREALPPARRLDGVGVAQRVARARHGRASRCTRSASSRTSPIARLLADRLAYEAAHDSMTGLLNRIELHRARRRPRSDARRRPRGRRAVHRPRSLQGRERQPRPRGRRRARRRPSRERLRGRAAPRQRDRPLRRRRVRRALRRPRQTPEAASTIAAPPARRASPSRSPSPTKRCS